MNYLDIILILALFLFFWTGFWRGLIKTIGGLVGIILGIFVAGLYYEDLALWASQFLPWSEGLFKVIAFILIFCLIPDFSISFFSISKTFNAPNATEHVLTFTAMIGSRGSFFSMISLLKFTRSLGELILFSVNFFDL